MIPLYPFVKSVLAKTRKIPASAPLVIQSFWPESFHPPSAFSALQVSAKASDRRPSRSEDLGTVPDGDRQISAAIQRVDEPATDLFGDPRRGVGA